MSQADIVEKLFGSHSRVSVLKLFLENEGKQYRVNEIARKASVNKRLASTELKRLNEIGIISPVLIGTTTFYTLNASSYLTKPLQDMFAEHDWYEWERPSRIHHLVLTLDAALSPMKEYYGYPMPDAHLVFDYDNVTWFFNMNEFRKIGEKIVPIYQKRKEQIWKDFHYFASTLGNHKDYASFYKNYIDFWKVAYIPELVSFYIDSLLAPGERITVQEKSFTEGYEDRLWELAKEADKKGIEKIDVSKLLKDFFWIRNSYYGIHRLTEEEVRTEVKKKIGKKRPQPVKMKDPTSLSKELLSVGKDMVFMQDIRKKYMMQAAYYLHELLKEIGKEYDLPPAYMEQTIPAEVLNLKNLMPGLKEELLLRQKSATVIGDIRNGIKVLSGQIIFPAGLSKKSKFEIRGMVACGGKSVGRAKIVTNVDQVYKVNHGDIIVSPMTSPDLMVAVRRCVGIVTDFGGITCHAAIVAREYNIPCIVGTKEATQRINDDDLVEVDANTGVVRVLERK